ncbi:MAG: anti-sigma factor domain-containing protein [Gemmatimonas sp.]
MSDYSMSELRDMAPAYVLGTLNAEEVAGFERALAASAELAAEVQASREVISTIGKVGDMLPPATVRARFLERVAERKRETPVNTNAVGARSLSVASGGQPLQRNLTPNGNDARARDRWLTGVLGVGLAASLLFAVQRHSQVASLSVALAERDSLLAERTLHLAQRDSALNTVLEAERNLVMVNLVSTPTEGPGIQFFWNVKQGRGLIHAFRLKPAAPGRAYQLWLIKDGKPVPSRVFNADADEHGLVWGIELPTVLTGVSAVAITDEPAGGSPQPTTTPFMIGEIPKGLP